MRWPNRKPHTLTPGMRKAQRAMAEFLPLIDWTRFPRRNINEEMKALASNIACFGCSDGHQAVLWLLRKDTLGPNGMLRRGAAPTSTMIRVPDMRPGRYRVTTFDTELGRVREVFEVTAGKSLILNVEGLGTDLALALAPV